jgi:hypothetical protein
MNTSHLVYSHCFLQCPNLHRIPVPCPNLLEIDDSLQQTGKANRKAVFVCPDCGLGSAYSAQDMVQDMIRGTPSLFLAGECHLVSLEIECDGQNCEAPKIVHTIQGDKKGTWKPTAALEDWHFSETALCGADHRLRLEGSKLHQVTATEMPF